MEELCVKLIGPGFGECILIGVGTRFWIIVDSCLDPDTSTVPALRYLSELGVVIETDVHFVVATHWHDDHIAGIGKIFEEAKNAMFVTSELLGKKSMQDLLVMYEKAGRISRTKGVEEWTKIVSIINGRPKSREWYRFVLKDTVLWDKNVRFDGTTHRVKITALSPTSAALRTAVDTIVSSMPSGPGALKMRVPSGNRNMASVVLLVEVDKFGILLGADLENGNDSTEGWLSILDSETTSYPRSEIFKIPHHGSSTGQNDRIWSELLEPNPLSLLTPFFSGRHKVPNKLELEYIANRTNRAYLTSYSRESKNIRLDPAVARTLHELDVDVYFQHSKLGSVEIRCPLDSLSLSACKIDLSSSGLEVLKALQPHEG